MTNALAHDFVGFLAVFGRHNIRPPSLCEQSELQCFASDLHRMFAQRTLSQMQAYLVPDALTSLNSHYRTPIFLNRATFGRDMGLQAKKIAVALYIESTTA